MNCRCSPCAATRTKSQDGSHRRVPRLIPPSHRPVSTSTRIRNGHTFDSQQEQLGSVTCTLACCVLIRARSCEAYPAGGTRACQRPLHRLRRCAARGTLVYLALCRAHWSSRRRTSSCVTVSCATAASALTAVLSCLSPARRCHNTRRCTPRTISQEWHCTIRTSLPLDNSPTIQTDADRAVIRWLARHRIRGRSIPCPHSTSWRIPVQASSYHDAHSEWPLRAQYQGASFIVSTRACSPVFARYALASRTVRHLVCQNAADDS